MLSSAIEGVIHDAARRGTLESPELQRELVHLADAYLTALENDDASAGGSLAARKRL